MNKTNISIQNSKFDLISVLKYLLKWISISTLVGVLVGSASAFFLISLDWATNTRENNLWIIALLPVGGLMIGLLYHYYGSEVVKGNNLILEEHRNPTKVIPLKMAPLVFIGTIITHLFGGSAGREGTAVQMGGSIADQFTRLFKLDQSDRKIILVIGISAGFSAVFGTPLAATIFALEVLVIGKMSYEALIPSFFTAVIAHFSCLAWSVDHTHYSIPFHAIPELSLSTICWTILVGILFGLTALLFSKSTQFWSRLFNSVVKYAPFRPMIGGIAVALAVYFLGTTKYIGLGIPTIVDAFHIDLNKSDFFIKILFTSFTLGAGFKGGEVTPLFFIGATLGNALVWFVPIPVALLAGMGFVAVFSGATNTPIACTIMGMELFGFESGIYLGIACFVAYLFSGKSGIYTSQLMSFPKRCIYDSRKKDVDFF